MGQGKSAHQGPSARAVADAEGADRPGLGQVRDAAWRAEARRAPEFILLVDDELRVRLLNHPQEGGPDPVGMSLLQFVARSDQDALVSAIRRARKGAVQHCHARAPGPHGCSVSYSVWVVPPSAADPDALTTLICTDLEHRMRIERALQDERSVLRSLLDYTPDHVMVVDRERNVLFANRAEGGLTQDEILRHPLEHFVHASDRPRVERAIEETFATGKGATLEIQVDLPDGTHWYETRYGPVVVEGEVQRVSITSSDITERRTREHRATREREALRESEERFRTLIEHAPEAVTIFDPASGVFSEANPQACRMFEASREQILQLSPADLSPAVQPDGVRSDVKARALVEAALAGHRPSFEWTHQTVDGRPIPCEIRLVRLPYGDRMLVRGSLIDISERKQAEAERVRLSEELFQARKLQAIGQLTGGVAHDFNNLLTVIMSQAEMLQLGAADVTAVHKRAGEILQACGRASTLTKSLLAFARRQPLSPRLVEPAEVVHRVAELLHRTLGEDVELRLHEDSERWTCEVDPVQLESALLNLALNARDAMPQGGRVDIGAANAHLPAGKTREGEAIAAGDYVVLSVEDDGEGMAPEVVEQAFEPFFTTKEVGSGSGLGLSMVHGFVRQSGGHVEIHSRLGRGTRVSIHLPRVRADRSALRASERAPAIPRGQGERVLVVEDEPQVREVTVTRLQWLGYETLDASDAASGLALLEKGGVDLLLTDVVLPGGMNGAQLARRALSLRPELPVVFMSGYPENALSDMAFGDARPTLVQKPFTQLELAVAVREALVGGAAAVRT